MVTPELLVEILTRAGARLGIGSSGRLVTAGVPPELQPTVDAYAEPLALAVAGRGSGHRWAPCSTCGKAQLIATGKAQPCKLTVRCDGKLKAYATPPPQDGNGLPCARPGCTNEAQLLTATHEPLCRPDFVHLAYALGAT